MPVFGPYPARVAYHPDAVHDGDLGTIRFDIDLGFGVELPGVSWTGRTLLSLRVMGINAPELGDKPAGIDARDYARTLLHPGDLCQVTSHGWDAYARRFDGDITLADGRDFATVMVEAGHAERKAYPGNN